jgi:hypothetical protein
MRIITAITAPIVLVAANNGAPTTINDADGIKSTNVKKNRSLLRAGARFVTRWAPVYGGALAGGLHKKLSFGAQVKWMLVALGIKTVQQTIEMDSLFWALLKSPFGLIEYVVGAALGAVISK